MTTWVNTRDYSVLELTVFGLGCLLWVVVYIITLHNIRRNRFVDIPLAAVCGNIVWEFLWSWVFQTDMGALFQWGYRIWFFLDCLIVVGAFRYGYKQITLPALRGHAAALFGFGILAWAPLLYYYINLYDAPISHNGVYSGYILNLPMSALFIPLYMRLRDQPEGQLFFRVSAWAKGVGTAFISAFCFLHYHDGFLLTLCVLTAVFDVAYLLLLAADRRPAAVPSPTLTTVAS
jgi:hypothetical protein